MKCTSGMNRARYCASSWCEQPSSSTRLRTDAGGSSMTPIGCSMRRLRTHRCTKPNGRWCRCGEGLSKVDAQDEVLQRETSLVQRVSQDHVSRNAQRLGRPHRTQLDRPPVQKITAAGRTRAGELVEVNLRGSSSTRTVTISAKSRRSSASFRVSGRLSRNSPAARFDSRTA